MKSPFFHSQIESGIPPNPLAMARWSQGRHGQWRELVVLALRRAGERGGSGGAADR